MTRSRLVLRDRAALYWLVALMLLTAAVYWRALGYWFAVEDDRIYVTHNPLLTSWHLRHLWTMWQAEISLNFAPLTLLSYSLDYHWWGMNPFGYHLTSLLWHLFNSIFVYVLLRAMRLERWGAWIGALWFALHPAQVESVVWIAERKNLLATAGTLVSVWAYLRAVSGAGSSRQPPHPSTAMSEQRPSAAGWVGGWRVLWFLAGVGAMLAKASAVMIPVLCVLVARSPHLCAARSAGRSDSVAHGQRPFTQVGGWRTSVRETWPLWLCALLVGLVHLQMQRGEIGLAEWRSGSWDGAVGVLVRAWALSLQLVARPGLLSLHHPVDPYVPSGGWQDPLVWRSAAVLLFAIGLLWWTVRRARQAGVWIGWFALTLAPMASLVFIGVHDRYLYMPMVGVAGVLGVVAEALQQRLRPRWIVGLGLAGLMGWLGWHTSQRVAVWRDPQILYADAVRHAPEADVPRIILAEVRREAGRQEEAQTLYRSLAAMTPARWNGWLMRGWARARLGDADGARAAFAQARALAPQHPLVNHFTGQAAADRGQWQAAVEAYGRVVARQPNADLYEGLAAASAALRQPTAAARWYRRAVAIEPWRAGAHRALARCLQETEARPSSVARELALADYWERAWSDLRAAHLRMSAVYRARGDSADAARSAREALQLAPTSVEARRAVAESEHALRASPPSR